MDCAQPICLPGQGAGCLPTSSSVTSPCSRLSGKSLAAGRCEPESPRDGYQQASTSTAETCESSISPHGSERWIAYQRAFLARIFLALDQGKVSRAHGPALSGRCSEQLTLFGPGWCSSKTRQRSGPKVDATFSGLSWREDIPTETERLPLLLSGQVMKEIAGGCSLPTLTVTSNWNRKGSGKKSGDGLATALKTLPTLTATFNNRVRKKEVGRSDGLETVLRSLPTICCADSKRSGGQKTTTKALSRLPGALKHRLPTLCASDYKSPYSEEGYQKQAQQRFKPLRDTLVHTTGHRLTPEFAEWWMGWPLRWTVALKERG